MSKTVHMITGLGVLRVLVNMHRKEGRNVRELKLYTTDDLRRLYQATEGDIIRLRDGIVSRVQLVSVIRWRIFWAQTGYGLLLLVSVIAMVASVIGVTSRFAQNRTLSGKGHEIRPFHKRRYSDELSPLRQI